MSFAERIILFAAEPIAFKDAACENSTFPDDSDVSQDNSGFYKQGYGSNKKYDVLYVRAERHLRPRTVR